MGMRVDTRHEPELLRAFATGDINAFDLLYEMYNVSLYRFIGRTLGKRHIRQQDEVFQDTWLRVIQAAETWEEKGASFRTWLFTVAFNRSIDVLRKASEVELSGSAVDGDDEGHSEDQAGLVPYPLLTDDSAHWRLACERLLHCVSCLTSQQREVFLLHHDGGLTVKDAAAALGIQYEAAKARLDRAMTSLKSCMGTYLPPEPAHRPTTQPRGPVDFYPKSVRGHEPWNEGALLAAWQTLSMDVSPPPALTAEIQATARAGYDRSSP
jgi:RNA polymerase sigma factor (sigma-70 family)